MSRPESRKTKYPTKVAEAAAPAPPVTPRRVGIGTLLRGAVALALMALVPVSWSFYANYLNANIVSRIGEFKTQAPNGLLLGMSDLRRAYTMNPHNPDNQYRYATAILKEESQKVRAKDLRTVDFAHLSECLSLLREAQRSPHIDHGKTTLIDSIFAATHLFRTNEAVAIRVMDNNELERERGITIRAKHCTVTWKDYLINIVDTPGHADFSGEVERTLSMVDSVLLLVDANEGPMPQTRYVLTRALRMGYRPVVIVNKVDRPQADPKGAGQDLRPFR